MSVVLQDSAEAYVAIQRAQIVGTILGTKETRFRVSNSGIQARLIDFEPPCRSSGDESAIRNAPKSAAINARRPTLAAFFNNTLAEVELGSRVQGFQITWQLGR